MKKCLQTQCGKPCKGAEGGCKGAEGVCKGAEWGCKGAEVHL